MDPASIRTLTAANATENGDSTHPTHGLRAKSRPETRETSEKGGRQNVARLCILRCTGAHIDLGAHAVRWYRWRCDVKYGWILLGALMAALVSTGPAAAQEWGADAAAESPPPATSDVAEIEAATEAQLEADETPKVTGFAPPGQSAEPGMGSQAAERERIRRSIGTVGESVRASGKTEDAIPLKFTFHGYYRARYNWIGNAPMPKSEAFPSTSAFPSKNASFGYHATPSRPGGHLRSEPRSSDRAASLHDRRLRQRRLWRQRPRVRRVPLFAVDQSKTTSTASTSRSR